MLVALKMPRTAADLAAGQVAPADVDHRQRAADGRAVGQPHAGRRGRVRQLAEGVHQRPLVRQHDAHPAADGDADAIQARLAGLQVDRRRFQQHVGLDLPRPSPARTCPGVPPAKVAQRACPPLLCARSAAGSMPAGVQHRAGRVGRAGQDQLQAVAVGQQRAPWRPSDRGTLGPRCRGRPAPSRTVRRHAINLRSALPIGPASAPCHISRLTSRRQVASARAVTRSGSSARRSRRRRRTSGSRCTRARSSARWPSGPPCRSRSRLKKLSLSVSAQIWS